MAMRNQAAALSGAPSSLTFAVNGTSTTVQLNNGSNGTESLQNISDAINSSGAGVNA